jgi:hypothetical protein
MVGLFVALAPGTAKTYGQAQHVYDFSTNAGVDRFAYGNFIPSSPLPPTANNVPSTELSGAGYTAISASDDSRYTTGLVVDPDRPATRFVFTLAEQESWVTQLDVRWEGGATTGGESATVVVWIWNATTSAYGIVGTTLAVPPPDGVISGSYTSSPAAYIDASNRVTLLVAANKTNKGVLTDHVRLTVTYQECWSNPDCDDSNVCTNDTCVGGFCQYANNSAPCSDGNPCTVSDVCSGGSCQSGSPPDCSGAGDPCNTASCDPLGAEGNCDTLTPAANGTPCDDGLPCTDGECQSGSCVFAGDTGQVTIDLEVDAIGTAVTRNVTFVVTTCPAWPDARVVGVSFDAFGMGTAVLDNVDIDATWMAATEGHTLRRLASLSFTACAATVSLTGTDWLVSGDFQTGVVAQDNLVDITDFSILAANWNTPIDPTLAMGADASGDGVQGTADFTAIQVNFLELGDADDGCPARFAAPSVVRVERHPLDTPLSPLTSVPVKSLLVPNGEAADLNGDGLVDAHDIRAFAALHDLPLLPEFSRKLTTLEEVKRGRSYRR